MKKKGEIMKFDYLKLANIIKTRRKSKRNYGAKCYR